LTLIIYMVKYCYWHK